MFAFAPASVEYKIEKNKKNCSQSTVYTLVWVLIIFFSNSVSAQDTLRLRIEDAEKQFLQKNLLLLAQQCQVKAQEALIIQAKTFANPILTANFNLYDPQNDIILHTGQSGQKDFMIEQLIQLGGKRSLNIELAKINKNIAEAELSDLLRSLRFALHQYFFSIHQSQKNILKCDRQLQVLDTLIEAYSKQSELGNVSMKDLIRLKAGYLKINSEKSESSLQLNEDMAKLKILLQTSSYVLTEVNSPFLDNLANEVPLTDLENKALKNRPDLAAGELDQRYAATFLKLEKRTVLPDATFNLSTDQRGGAFQNQINFGVSMPLPILNQNRGKISSAKFQLQSSAYLLNQLKSEVLSEVFSASQNMNRSIQEYKKSKGLYDQNFEKVLSSVNDNFKRRNMSILEFLDFLESYNDGLKEIERIKNQIAINAAQINFVTATKVY